MARLAERLRDPVLWSEISQLVKTVAAAVLAWVIAAQVFGLVQPFLAPWAALLTVHATVYRTLARGAQQVSAAVLGVVFAWAAGSTLGINVVSLGLVLLAAMVAGSVRALRAESTTAAATALMVLLTGYIHSGSMLLGRLLDTAIGIGVGLLVNLLVWPPLRDRAAARRVDTIDDRIGELLTGMARDLGGGDEPDVEAWVDRTRELDHDIDDARALVRQARESGRLNLRRRAAPRVRATEDFDALLGRLEQAVAELRSMARTIERSGAGLEWWRDLLRRAGEAVSAADAQAIAEVRATLDAPPGGLRPSAGALVVNLANILDAMDAVADAQPVRERAPAPDRLGRFARERVGDGAVGGMSAVQARDREHAADR
jgi:uncharacterized membrane protein YgaE (UPF0421/DUF939 family)